MLDCNRLCTLHGLCDWKAMRSCGRKRACSKDCLSARCLDAALHSVLTLSGGQLRLFHSSAVASLLATVLMLLQGWSLPRFSCWPRRLAKQQLLRTCCILGTSSLLVLSTQQLQSCFRFPGLLEGQRETQLTGGKLHSLDMSSRSRCFHSVWEARVVHLPQELGTCSAFWARFQWIFPAMPKAGGR